MTSPLAVAFLAERLPSSGVNVAAAAVAWRLAVYAEDIEHTAWPKVKTLADQVGLHPGNVRRALARLEAAGLLVIERARGKSSLYRFPIPPDPTETGPPHPVDNSEDREQVRALPRGGARGSARGVRAVARAISKREVEKEVARPTLETVTAGHVCDSCHEPVTGLELGRFRHRRCPTPHVERITGVVWCQEVVNR